MIDGEKHLLSACYTLWHPHPWSICTLKGCFLLAITCSMGIGVNSASWNEALMNASRIKNNTIEFKRIFHVTPSYLRKYAYMIEWQYVQVVLLSTNHSGQEPWSHSIVDAMMDIYQNMGDAFTLQYGGFAAHNSVFLGRYGKWKQPHNPRSFWSQLTAITTIHTQMVKSRMPLSCPWIFPTIRRESLTLGDGFWLFLTRWE